MKRCYLLLIALLVITMAAPAASQAAPPVEDKPVSVAFFVPMMEDPWYVGAAEGAKRKAAEMGVDLQLYDATNKVDRQIQQFDTAVAAGVDAIILSGVDPKAMVPSVESAVDAGIKVVVYDRPIWETAKLDLLLQLDTPNMGVMGAQAIVDRITAKHGEPKGKVIRVFGDLADTWVTYITEGWDPVMAKYPDIQILTAVSGQWEVETAATNVTQILATNPDVDAIFVDSDWLSTGIVAYLEGSGTFGKAGEDSHIYFVGVNGNPEALEYIREGWMDATISTPVPDLTGAAVDLAVGLVRGEPLPAEYVQEGAAWSPATIFPTPQYGKSAFPKEEGLYKGPVLNMLNEMVNRDNVDDPLLWGNLIAQQVQESQ
jgi:ABC-type sugar transport system substrate-binding protein